MARTILCVTSLPPRKYQLEWREHGDLPLGAVRVWNVEADADVVRNCRENLTAAVEGLSAHTAGQPGARSLALTPLESLQAAGRTLFNTLIPNRPEYRDLREKLLSLDSPLIVRTDDPSIPWELLYDGTDFLAMRLDLGRTLTIQNLMDAQPRRDRRPRCLIIADPEDNLPEARCEAEALQRLLEQRNVECVSLSGLLATKPGAIQALGVEYDFIHYCGHVVPTAEGYWALELRNGEKLAGEDFARLIQGRPSVFVNGCKSASAMQGLTQSLLVAGARLVVGSMFQAPDRGARIFSEKFYELALDGSPVGEALKEARRHTKRDKDCGLAWACYVLYGDPLTTLDLVDPLMRVLKDSELKPDDFTDEAGTVLREALQLGSSRGIQSGHLFTALIVADKAVRRWLGRLGKEEVGGMLREFLKDSKIEGLSETVHEALQVARTSAEGKPIQVSHLRCGFARTGGGLCGDLLTELGLDIRALDDCRGSPPKPGAVESVGGVRESDCLADGWAVLLEAVALAGRGGCAAVGSAHILAALLADPNSLAARNLAFLHVQLELGKFLVCGKTPVHLTAAVSVSESIADILFLAQSNSAAGNTPISAADLLAAFVQNGGGGIGRGLGTVLCLLRSRLVREGGMLDYGRFDDTARACLDAAIAFAIAKGHPHWGRQHLLYGLLQEGQLLTQRIRKQDRDPELVADLLHTADAGTGGGPKPEAFFRAMTQGLVKVLCDAERRASAGPPKDSGEGLLIGEEDLLDAWVADGGGTTGKFLVGNGLKIRRLSTRNQ